MKNRLILKIMIIVGFICSALIFMNNVPAHYSSLFLLPFCSAVFFFITSLKIGNNNINVAISLIFSITLIRYCLHPLLMAYGHFNTVMKVNIQENAEPAVFLMIYECFAIYMALILSSPKKNLTSSNVYSVSFTKKGWLTLFFLLSYILFALVVRPDLKNLFMSIFQIGENEFTHAGRINEYSVGTFTRIISTLFSFVFLTIRIILPIYVLGWLIKKKKSNFILILCTFLFVLLEFLFVTATFAESIISSLIVILSVGKSDKNLFKSIMKIAPIFVVGIIVFYFYTRYQVSNMAGGNVSKYDGNTTIEYLATLINAYFTGIDNVAAGFNLERNERIKYFLSSAQVTIPFNTTIFGRADEILPSYYNRVNSEIGQIPSTIGNGYFYFGTFFAPVFSFLFAYYANKFNNLALQTRSYWFYIVYLLIAVLLSLGLGMYNEVIIGQYLFNWVIPTFFVAKLLSK